MRKGRDVKVPGVSERLAEMQMGAWLAVRLADVMSRQPTSAQRFQHSSHGPRLGTSFHLMLPQRA